VRVHHEPSNYTSTNQNNQHQFWILQITTQQISCLNRWYSSTSSQNREKAKKERKPKLFTSIQASQPKLKSVYNNLDQTEVNRTRRNTSRTGHHKWSLNWTVSESNRGRSFTLLLSLIRRSRAFDYFFLKIDFEFETRREKDMWIYIIFFEIEGV